MLIDARSLPENTAIHTDVCIVGAGAAGITLAREFAGQPFRVCLLESGGLEFDGKTQSLYKGKIVGHPYSPLDAVRLRFFGGSTNHWTGWCRPLDAIDFETREGIPYSGWPFARSHLDPYYERAHTICQLGPYSYDAAAWEPKEALRFPHADSRIVPTVYHKSPPTRFGQVYRDEIQRADNITTYLHANVIDIETTRDASTVTRLRVACLAGNKFWVTAKLFILAAGGIENARLLLLANTVHTAGLGNQHDLVGRFFTEHLYLQAGLILSAAIRLPIPPSMDSEVHGRRVRRVVRLTAETLRRERLLNFSAALVSTPTKGIASLRLIVQELRRGEIPDDFARHLSNVITHIDEVASATYRRMRGYPPYQLYTLFNRTEQAPNPDSRVMLTTEHDQLGKPRVQLDWRLSTLDKHSIIRAHEILGEELGRADFGRLKVTLDAASDWPQLLNDSHHMGTTRMHIDPTQGVVDANCKVHGLSDLFIAGCSVFPTGGFSNPTLTIVALAVRLADHVKRLLG
jgi:choline dehydrogenase-like flavoprotein